jgi:hypothetical protein
MNAKTVTIGGIYARVVIRILTVVSWCRVDLAPLPNIRPNRSMKTMDDPIMILFSF